MLEYEKYQDLQAKTQKTQEEYERQITELENQKEEEVSKKRTEYTSQLEKIKNDLILVSFFILYIRTLLRLKIVLKRFSYIRR